MIVKTLKAGSTVNEGSYECDNIQIHDTYLILIKESKPIVLIPMHRVKSVDYRI